MILLFADLFPDQNSTMRSLRYFVGIVLLLGSSLASGQDRFTIVFRNGLTIGPGIRESVDTVSVNTFTRAAARDSGGSVIDYLDDGWRRTHYNASKRNVPDDGILLDNRPAFTPIRFAAADDVQKSGNRLNTVIIQRIEKFNRFGRRALTVMNARRSFNVVQQITELTPQYYKMQLLHGADEKIVWDSRESLTMMPSDQLHAILEQQLDLSRHTDWLDMYAFYLAAGRFNEAIHVLEEGIQRFPSELGPRKNLIAQAYQLFANRQFEEIGIRREAGQWKLASELLGAFNNTLLETQINAKKQRDDLIRSLKLIDDITQSIRKRVSQLSTDDQAAIKSVIDELLAEISVESANRFDDYVRLSSNPDAKNENMVALALGGWILGPSSGLQNFATAKSLVRTRRMVQEYLGEPDLDANKRAALLNQISSEEGGQHQLIAKLISTMKPPRALPTHRPEDPPGFYRLQVKSSNAEPVDYIVQLPPEYDPNRLYPCILALPGRSSHFESNLPIDFWCGQPTKLNSESEPQRFGSASRYGYVVISPKWMSENQVAYLYTEAEKNRVLSCYRDALRRISINTDKVFISGHFDGAAAAWDIVSSHPDMWAGAIMFSPVAEKYIVQYHRNLRAQEAAPEQVPPATYIVFGELDELLEDPRGLGITVTADHYLKDSFYDCLFVQHIGQPRELFSAEVPRIFEWMQLPTHQRLKTPKAIKCYTLRSSDRMFYWLEAPQIADENITNPLDFDPKRDSGSAGSFEAMLLDPSQNGIRVSKIPSRDRSALVWLTPAMVDFNRDVMLMMNDRKKKVSVSGKVDVMLEDVRRRGDRQHFFWDVIDTARLK